LLDSSEAQADIEYWLEGQSLHVVRSTSLYDEHRFVPFIEHVFQVAQVPAQEDLVVLVKGDPSLVDDIPQFVEVLLGDEWSPDVSRALRSLYSAGLADPEAVLHVTPHLRRSRIFAGGEAATISDLERELKLVRRAGSTL
jgi:hypothetical protein